ncbi:MAG: S8 family serine peptidase [Vicinamibacterales bacterium]
MGESRHAVRFPRARVYRALLVPLIALSICTGGLLVLRADSRPVRYVINVPGDRLPAQLSEAVEQSGGRLVRRLPQIGVAIALSSNPGFVRALATMPGLTIESVGRVAVDQIPPTISGNALDGPTAADDLYNSGKLWGVNRVRADLAWSAGFTGSHRTVVAVIDSGIAWNHPDLQPNVVFATCITSSPPCIPYPWFSDHGTHVAGTIAGAFGGGSVIGVGPHLALASYNIFEFIPDCGFCSYVDSRWAAMMDAARRGSAVINVSLGHTRMLGGRGSNDVAAHIAAEKKVANYVSRANTVTISSAGNSSLNLVGPIVHLPGDIPALVNVAATIIRPLPVYPQAGAFDAPAFYSNFGAPITIGAPGGDLGPDDPGTADPIEYMVISTGVSPDSDCALTASCPVFYDWKIGTSMAAAHVTGTAGLIRDANPSLTARQVTALLKRTADKSGSRQLFGHGVVDAFAALQTAVKP